jgi:serine/threonine-protein kinase
VIGQTVSHYQVLRKLGGGGMGVVYQARDLTLDRLAALKFLSPVFCTDAEHRDRFIREAKLASALDHPNICTIYGIECLADDHIFIAMAYYEGETLQARLGRGQLPIDEAVHIAAQVASGLAAAHDAGIVHRDIKPANVIITRHGDAKILDFGIAKLARGSGLTAPGAARGTLEYMAPEQASGEEVDHRADLWGLGLLLYESLAGEQPFAGRNDMAVLYAILSKQPAPLTELRADVPERLGEIVERALAKDPAARYGSAAELLSELRAFRRTGPATARPAEAVGASDRRRTVAVLPFTNLGSAQDDEYFSDGLTEELISALAKINGLRVMARSSAFQFKGAAHDARDVGRRLGVGTVLEGSVRRAGQRLRVSAQLVDVATGYSTWSETYERAMRDIFLIQEEIAGAISAALAVRLTEGAGPPATERHRASLEAYHLYLKGRYAWNRRTRAELRQSITYFDQAIENFPAYARAYAGKADAYAMLGMYEYLAPRDAFPAAFAAAARALEIDPSLAEAHASLACVKAVYDWDWRGAELGFRKAIELDPAYAIAHQWYAIDCLMPQGRYHEALAAIQRARDLDPLSRAINATIGLQLYFLRQYELAAEQYRRTLEVDPDFAPASFFLGQVYLQTGAHDEALTELGRAVALSPESTEIVATLSYAHAVAGQAGEARRVLTELKAQAAAEYISPYLMALCHAGLGELDQAFEWLQQAVAGRCYKLVYLAIDPKLDRLRADPRFDEIMRGMDLKVPVGVRTLR